MNETASSHPRILLVGGSGRIGRLLLAELLHATGSEIWIAARRAKRLESALAELEPRLRERVTARTLNLSDASAVRAAVAGAGIVACAAGPARGLPTTLAEACLEAGVPYVDLADDRSFVARVRALAAEADPEGTGPAVATGWSSASALSVLLTAIGAADLDQVDSIDVAFAPGGAASRTSLGEMLESAGAPLRVLRQGLWCTVAGWSEPGEFHFPDPVGMRRGWLVDGPQREVLARIFGARRVEFRAAGGRAGLDRALGAVARARRRGLVKHPCAWLGPARLAQALTLGRHGPAAIGVEIEGRYGEHPLRKRVSIVSTGGAGERLAVLPASYVIARLAGYPGTWRGPVPLERWIERSTLELECERRGLQLVVEEE